MSDIFIKLGKMDYNSDTAKVATKYTLVVDKQMRAGATRGIAATAGYTVDGDASGFQFFATLSEISFGTSQGEPTVTCKLEGTVTSYPDITLNVAKVSGKATLRGGATDRDVSDCIFEAAKATMVDRVIPYIQTLPGGKPQPKTKP